jgi:phosphoglycolate phosphatase
MHKPGVASWRGQRLRAVLFDLDGTLLDTAADIALALNRTMVDYGCQTVADREVRRMIGRGSPILIERAIAAQGRALDDATRAAMVERFFHYYGELEQLNEATAEPFSGAAESLRAVHDAGLGTAVVTNKQYRFADALLATLAELPTLIELIPPRIAGAR